jgi:hypothetical protein
MGIVFDTHLSLFDLLNYFAIEENILAAAFGVAIL